MRRKHYLTYISALLGVSTIVVGTSVSQGATYAAATTNVVDIQAKINLTQNGDTVVVPAGTSRWTKGLSVTKNITIRGAGIGKTIIIDEVPRAPGSHTLKAVLSEDLPFRFTGFEFRGSTNVTQPSQSGVLSFQGKRGVTRQFRLDHCKFSELHGLSLRFSDLTGVVDHCTVSTLDGAAIHVFHPTWGGGGFGHGSWADYPYWGSEKFLFIEDCIIINCGIDAYEGARFVVRHNSFNDGQVTTHGTEGQGRGAKQLEVYNNVFTVASRRGAAQARSGTVVVHDNTYNNFTKGMDLKAYRQIARKKGTWGISSGSNPWDVNNSVLGALEQGTHTGVNSASTLVDSTQNWALNQWGDPVDSHKGFSYIIRNITQNKQSVIVSNTTRTISYFKGTPTLTFDRGDRYEIWKVITSLDQPGQGKGDLLSGLPASPKGWPHNAPEPCYSWNNKDENGNELDFQSVEGSIEEGRDFYNRTRKPNYAPYPYPHPLSAAN